MCVCKYIYIYKYIVTYVLYVQYIYVYIYVQTPETIAGRVNLQGVATSWGSALNHIVFLLIDFRI